MSEAATDVRPWHGKDNPFEAIFDDYTGQIAALRSEIGALKAGQAKAAADLAGSAVSGA